MNLFNQHLISVADAADIIGCSRQQIYRYAKAGMLDFCRVRIGTLRTIKFDSEKLSASINNGYLGIPENESVSSNIQQENDAPESNQPIPKKRKSMFDNAFE
jgi:predicted site-specific integrase-resolvase